MRSTLGNHDDRLMRLLGSAVGADPEAERCIAALDSFDAQWSSWLGARPLSIEVDG